MKMLFCFGDLPLLLDRDDDALPFTFGIVSGCFTPFSSTGHVGRGCIYYTTNIRIAAHESRVILTIHITNNS